MADINWSLGYSSKYYLSIVDWGTMKDLDRIEITGGSIKRSLTDLRESADIDCINYNYDEEKIIRVWLDTNQNGSSSHTPLFTGLAVCPSDKYQGRLKTNSLECYSMLKIAQDIMLPRGWYAPIDANSGFLIKDLLSVTGVNINIIEDSVSAPDLTQSIIAESGETRLSMVDKILSAMGKWRMRLDGYGSVFVEPIPNDESAMFDSNEYDVIETSIDIKYDWYNAPNVLRCILDDSFAEVRDEDDNSPLSIQNRKREVWLEDSDVQLSNDESLGEYAQRMLKVYQQASTTVSYSRRYDPNVYLSDIVRINYPAQNVMGLYRITDQSITLGYNATTSEEVTKIV